MRRALSILLVLAFGLGPLAPSLDLSGDASLPPCCRRHGAHHCAMAMRMAASAASAPSDASPAVSAPLTCPNYPGPAALMTGPTPAILSAALRLPPLRGDLYAAAARLNRLRSRPGVTHAGRGPPTAIPSPS
jgi:hypothetical protein